MLAAGAAGYISKPLRETQLFAELQRVLHLVFTYAPEECAPVRDPANETQRLAHAFAALDADARAGIRQAAERGDIAALRRLFDAIARARPDLAPALQRLADRYAYEQIVRLLPIDPPSAAAPAPPPTSQTQP